MGFLDDLKRGANNLADSINRGVSSAQQQPPAPVPPGPSPEMLLRDLGALTYLGHTGRSEEQSEAEVARILAALYELERAGVAIDLRVHSAAAQPPPGSVPPPGGGVQPPPPPGSVPGAEESGPSSAGDLSQP